MTDYREASADDLPAIRALLASCALPVNDLTPAMLRGFLVARHAGQVVGTAGVEPVGADALLRSVAVAPDHRGLGIAERLCDLLEARAKQAGAANLYLLTETAEGYFAQRGSDPSNAIKYRQPCRPQPNFATSARPRRSACAKGCSSPAPALSSSGHRTVVPLPLQPRLGSPPPSAAATGNGVAVV